MPNNLGLDPFLDPVGHFGAPWWPFCISRPLIGRNTECSDQKTYLAKVVRSAHITIEKWSPFFDLGGPRLVCLPPKGEGKRKVARIKKLILRKLFAAPILLYRSDLGFLIWGVQDLFAFPRRGKANEKLLGWKNLFSESWLERPSYYKEVTSVFWFGKCKLASAALQAVRRCRRWASAPGAARLVFMLRNQK